FHDALDRAGVDVTSPVEPISDSFRQHRRNVGLQTAAAELGVPANTLLTNLGRLSPVLAPLASGTVKRDTWAARFPETVCLLKLGDARDPACDVDEPDVPDDGEEPDGQPPEAEVAVYGDCANDAATVC